MVKILSCVHGHHWQAPVDALGWAELSTLTCPLCGAKADTVSEGSNRGDTKSGSSDPRRPLVDPNRLTGYEILGEAGRGGMGVVYRARDRRRDRIVALKTLQRIDAVALQRFKKEFRSLSDVAHPNLVSLYELISDGENWCFTMELIEGVDILHYIRHGWSRNTAPDLFDTEMTTDIPRANVLPASGGLSMEQLARLRSVAAQLATGISALHAAGILHRDIKPSNVLVTQEGRAVLLDFGLAAALDESNEHRASRDSILGTVAYMSPEQAASNTITHATDWYALGVLLYEAITGQPPFTGKPLAVLQAKQRADPPAPSAVWAELPADLDELCVRLLARDPARRATAGDVLRVLQNDASARVASGVREDVQIEAGHLIGRDRHLAALRAAYADVADGRPASVFVRGASGNGKTTLVKAFLEGIPEREKAVVLSGRCYERESVPFKAIDSMIDSLVAYLSRLPRAEADAVMPRDVQALTRLFPVFGRIEVQTHRRTEFADQQELNRRAIGALREMLVRIGDRCRLVVCIDDLQWGDEDSAAMLSDLLQPPDAPLLLFLGTYRSEDAESSPFLQAFRQIQLQREIPLNSLQVDVKPLDHAEAVRLALELLGRADALAHQHAESIATEAAGNPYFVAELVAHLQHSGERVSEPVQRLAMVDMLWSRVQRLPQEPQRLLQIVAVWGQPLPLDQALRVAGVSQSALGPLRAGHLVRTVASSSTAIVETYHDRVRETVNLRLDPATRQHCHLVIAAEYMQNAAQNANEILDRLSKRVAFDSTVGGGDLRVDADWFDIAFHYDAAGRPDLAFPYALATAESARFFVSNEVSEQQYRIAERGVGNHETGVQFRVAEGLGDVLMLRGHYDEARSRFERALKLAPECEASIKAKLGELAFKKGDMEGAIEEFESALHLLGQDVPGSDFGTLLRVARESAVQLLHSLLPSLFTGRKQIADADRTLLTIRLHNRLTYAYWFKRGQYLCLWSHLRGMNLAERYPPTLELAHSYSIHAPVMGLLAFFDRGIAYAQKSLAIYTSFGNLWGQGQALNFHGVVLHSASRFDECIEKCREAVDALERAGDLWEVNVARVHTAFSLFRRGELRACAELVARIHSSGVELGDAQAAGFGLDVWSQATGGQLTDGVLARELHRPREDVQVRCQVLLAEGVRQFWQANAAQAVEIFQQAHLLAEAAGVRNSYVLPLRAWLASALRRQAETLSAATWSQRDALLKQAERVARKAVRVARKHRNDLPHSLRECGLIAAMQGNVRKARQFLDASLQIAEAQGARFELAQTLFARGRWGQRHGWPDASQDVATAEEALRGMGAEFALQAAPLAHLR